MCGIIGYIGSKDVVPILINGLKRLEYRGYDSAGIAVLANGSKENGNGLLIHKKKGKIHDLELSLIGLGFQSCFSTDASHLTHNASGSSVLSPQSSPFSPIASNLRPTFSRLASNVLVNIGLGHTRWATHGKPSDENAHPHGDCEGKIAVVHNGIIENYSDLKKKLISEGHRFTSQTDTEVIAHLIERELNGDLAGAVVKALRHIDGSYAIGVICRDDPERMIVARKGSPLVLGCGVEENFIASDVPAILPYTKKVIYLNDGEIAEICSNKINLCSLSPHPSFSRESQVASGKGLSESSVPSPQSSSLSPDALRSRIHEVTWDASMAEKCGYKHFMLKEIFEQPRAIRDILGRYAKRGTTEMQFDEMNLSSQALRTLQKIYIIACGTSHHAALIGKLMLEKYAKVAVEVDIASEFRYRSPLFPENCLTIAISQSGETADTLAAIRQARENGSKVLSICNVVGSSVTRDSHGVIYTHAGPEIGVASTKAFTTQIVALCLFTIYLTAIRNPAVMGQCKKLAEGLHSLPEQLDRILTRAEEIRSLAVHFKEKKDFLYLGRSFGFPIALEGALKLKEISYIHAEGYPAGEMKHGPIALINEEMPVVALAPRSGTYDKILSNIEEVKARGGTVIALATEGDERIREKADHVFYIPDSLEELSTLYLTIPLQLLAYYVADARGCEIDQPRNLAKSVTVE